MRLVDNFNKGQLHEESYWYELKGTYKEYERRSYNLKLIVHSTEATCEIYPMKDYERNAIIEGERIVNTPQVGYSRDTDIYHKKVILDYLNQFFPHYISVEVYVLTEDVCYRETTYTAGTGCVNHFKRDVLTHELTSVGWNFAKIEAKENNLPKTIDVLFRKVVDMKKIDTIIKAEERKLEPLTFYVYEHYYYDEDLQKEIVFYVGKGTGEAKGPGSRIYSFNRNKFWQEIVRSLDERNIKWEYRIVKFFNSNTEALEFEVELQEHYWNQGQCLGCADLRRRHKHV